jgi:hypothetical protein
MSSTTVQIQGIISHPYIFKPKRNNLNHKDEYSADILFSKDTDLKVLTDAIEAAIEKKFGADKNRRPKNLAPLIKDGDEKGAPAYENMFYITAKSSADHPVNVRDKSNNILQHQSDIQPGDTVNACLSVFAYDNVKKGVSCQLLGIQLWSKTDKPLNGRPSKENMFDSFADDSYLEQNSEMFN